MKVYTHLVFEVATYPYLKTFLAYTCPDFGKQTKITQVNLHVYAFVILTNTYFLSISNILTLIQVNFDTD